MVDFNCSETLHKDINVWFRKYKQSEIDFNSLMELFSLKHQMKKN